MVSFLSKQNYNNICSNFNKIWKEPLLNFPCYKKIVDNVLVHKEQCTNAQTKYPAQAVSQDATDPVRHTRHFKLVFGQQHILIGDTPKSSSSLQLICYKISLTFKMIVNVNFNNKLIYAFNCVNKLSKQHEQMEQWVSQNAGNPDHGRRHFDYKIEA